jgi:hypothetical protein
MSSALVGVKDPTEEGRDGIPSHEEDSHSTSIVLGSDIRDSLPISKEERLAAQWSSSSLSGREKLEGSISSLVVAEDSISRSAESPHTGQEFRSLSPSARCDPVHSSTCVQKVVDQTDQTEISKKVPMDQDNRLLAVSVKADSLEIPNVGSPCSCVSKLLIYSQEPSKNDIDVEAGFLSRTLETSDMVNLTSNVQQSRDNILPMKGPRPPNMVLESDRSRSLMNSAIVKVFDPVSFHWLRFQIANTIIVEVYSSNRYHSGPGMCGARDFVLCAPNTEPATCKSFRSISTGPVHAHQSYSPTYRSP